MSSSSVSSICNTHYVYFQVEADVHEILSKCSHQDPPLALDNEDYSICVIGSCHSLGDWLPSPDNTALPMDLQRSRWALLLEWDPEEWDKNIQYRLAICDANYEAVSLESDIELRPLCLANIFSTQTNNHSRDSLSSSASTSAAGATASSSSSSSSIQLEEKIIHPSDNSNRIEAANDECDSVICLRVCWHEDSLHHYRLPLDSVLSEMDEAALRIYPDRESIVQQVIASSGPTNPASAPHHLVTKVCDTISSNTTTGITITISSCINNNTNTNIVSQLPNCSTENNIIDKTNSILVLDDNNEIDEDALHDSICASSSEVANIMMMSHLKEPTTSCRDETSTGDELTYEDGDFPSPKFIIPQDYLNFDESVVRPAVRMWPNNNQEAENAEQIVDRTNAKQLTSDTEIIGYSVNFGTPDAPTTTATTTITLGGDDDISHISTSQSHSLMSSSAVKREEKEIPQEIITQPILNKQVKNSPKYATIAYHKEMVASTKEFDSLPRLRRSHSGKQQQELLHHRVSFNWSVLTELDINKELRQMDDNLKKAESVQKTIINDDGKFPDSVTPSKVERNLINSMDLYDIPYADDEAYICGQWFLMEDHHWTLMADSLNKNKIIIKPLVREEAENDDLNIQIQTVSPSSLLQNKPKFKNNSNNVKVSNESISSSRLPKTIVANKPHRKRTFPFCGCVR